jgi:hypothetical protein
VRDVILLAVRVLVAGAFVAGFAMLGDTLKPKMFAGLLSGAPSVATVSLLVTGLAMGPSRDEKYALGMIAGAVGLVVYAVVAAYLVEHLKAVVGSALAWIAWAVPAGAIYAVFLR